jgi:hypothetical protein
MSNRELIKSVVKQVIKEHVEFSHRVQPDSYTLMIGNKIERKIWYVYCNLNKNGEMFKSPLITTFPRENKKEFMCQIAFTTDKVNVTEEDLTNFIEKFYAELKKQFDYEILNEPVIYKKEFEREVGNVKGMVPLLRTKFNILVKPNFKPQKEIDILQHTPDAKADRERRMREKFKKAEQALFGTKQTSLSNPSRKA